ncbi:lipoate protein ligase C-terminus [Clostridium frigidicarnis]|uniref:lipoate--protein ligase n=1 Tax=Clostridium frigidicarnis TaxID=84698 RepID=A0A1I1A9D9_9CLOT|nr:lipoate protein ligase C-terminal domain-containing protein [Clostridium frigidicarnis]SFB33100.1 lipoate protein ligase C-terminus [Clostridium frigidicarnis]
MEIDVLTFKNKIFDYSLKSEKDVIKDIKIFGDFFGVKDIKEIEDLLKDIEHNKGKIGNIIKNVNIDEYFSRITMEEFISLF